MYSQAPAEAFTAEAIRPDTTPTLYRMANQGIQFTDYYQFDTAGTTGGECGNLFGVRALKHDIHTEGLICRRLSDPDLLTKIIAAGIHC